MNDNKDTSLTTKNSISGLTLPDGVVLSLASAAIPDGELPDDFWEQIIIGTDNIGDSQGWWQADICIEAQKRFKNYHDIAERLKVEPATLANRMSIARNVEKSRRNPNLSMSHHAVVTALHPLEQTEWLDKAAEGQWSVTRFREEIRTFKASKNVSTVPAVALRSNSPTPSKPAPAPSQPVKIVDASPVEVDLKTGNTSATGNAPASSPTAPAPKGGEEFQLFTDEEIERIPEGQEVETLPIGSGKRLAPASSPTVPTSPFTRQEVAADAPILWEAKATLGRFTATCVEKVGTDSKIVYEVWINGRAEQPNPINAIAARALSERKLREYNRPGATETKQ